MTPPHHTTHLQPRKSSRRPLARILATAVFAASGLTLMASVSTVHAAPTPTLNWITWTNPTFSQTDGSLPQPGFPPYTFNYATQALGEITMPGSTTVYVKLSGEVVDPTAVGNPSAFGLSGDSYWRTRINTQGAQTYTSTNVPTLPTVSDRVGVVGSSVPSQTLTFYSDSARTIPANVSNIVMNIYSLGAPTSPGAWDFNQMFSILSDNRPHNSNFGFTKSSPTVGTHRLSASEGSGTIQFNGTFDSISWTVTQPEAFATWNIGVTSANPPLDVTFDTQGGSSIAAQTTTIGGSLADPGIPTRSGYTFAGWFDSDNGGSPITFPHAHGRTIGFTLFAQWIPTVAPVIPVETTTTITTVASPTEPTIASEARPTKLPSTGNSSQVPLLAGASLLILGIAVSLRRRLA